MEKFDIHQPKTSLNNRVSELPDWKKLDIIEVRVGSHSDFPKIPEILEWLNDYPLLVRIASAHRTTDAMIAFAKSFPNVQVSLEWEDPDWTQVSAESRDICKKLNVVACIAAAWWSAHIAGMTASDTHIPVIGYPVPSSTNGQSDSDPSMRDMPPHKPNGVSAYESVIVQQAKAIYDFTHESSQEIYIDPTLSLSQDAQKIIELTGVQIVHSLTNWSQIWIHQHAISDSEIDYEDISREGNKKNKFNRSKVADEVLRKTESFGTPIVITNPIYNEAVNTDDRTHENIVRNGIIAANRLTTPGLSMSSSVDWKTNLINSLIFAAEIIAKVNPEVKDALIAHREALSQIVRDNDMNLVTQQTQ